MSIGVWRYVRPAQGPERLTIAHLEGEVRLEGPNRVAEAALGDAVQTDDHLTTLEGRAVLELEGGTRVRVGPSSSVRVLEVGGAGVELELEEGALKATVRPESGSLAVTGAGITAQATNADFDFGVDDEIAVLQSTRGDVAVMGADIGRLAAGSRAVIRRRSAAVGPIPDDLLLTVQWPEKRRTRARKGEVTGSTTAGARVQVQGAFGTLQVRADEKGRFRAEVPLAEGDNPVEVSAVDLFGAEAEVRGVLQTRDTSPPKLRGSVEYGP